MVAFKVARRVGPAACVAMGLLLMASAAAAQGAKLCLPAKEGRPVVTPVKGVCPKHYTLTELGKDGASGKEGKQGPAGLSLLSEEEQKALKAILPYVKFTASGVGGKPTIQVSGANLQIVNGTGAYAYKLNGAGNLIIGYDENAGAQTGSHNLMLGYGQSYTNEGGIIGGQSNTASGPDSFVVGSENKAEGEEASVSGGSRNTASGLFSSVSGGSRNSANWINTAVSGGEQNSAGNLGDSVSGGRYNQADGGGYGYGEEPGGASVSGGEHNTAFQIGSSVSGGEYNEADGCWAWAGGGYKNRSGSTSGFCEGGPFASLFGGKELKATHEYEAIP